MNHLNHRPDPLLSALQSHTKGMILDVGDQFCAKAQQQSRHSSTTQQQQSAARQPSRKPPRLVFRGLGDRRGGGIAAAELGTEPGGG